MPVLTPGVLFLGRGLASLLFSCAIIFAGRYVLDAHLGVHIPSSVLATAFVVLFPLLLLLRYYWGQYDEHRRAAALGARVVPRLAGKWPGNFDKLLEIIESVDSGYIGDAFWEWTKDHGTTVNASVLFENEIWTYEPEHIKIILASDFDNYVKGDRFTSCMFSVLGTGVFNSDGDMWKFHRSMTRPFFSRDRISAFDNFERHAELVIQHMKDRFRAGYAIDFQDIMHRFTLDSASEFLFGKDVNSLADPLPYPHFVERTDTAHSSSARVFSQAFADAQYVVSERAVVGWLWPLLEIFEDKTKKPMKIVSAYLDPIMEEAIEKHQSTENKIEDVSDNETFLDHLVRLTKDRTVLKDEILNILVAARDTTTSTMSFMVYLLATHPKVMERLREEVLDKVGPSARPTFDDIRDMKYLRAVINETLRLFPSVPFNVRQTVHETTWPSPDPTQKPIYIPAQTPTVYSAFLMHRRTDLWGPDAHEFDPDRFLDSRLQTYLIKNPFIFVPFNAGPRICIGQQFAYNEMSFMFIRLLQNFSSIALDEAAQPPDTRPPKKWKGAEGRKGIEKVWPKFHLTVYCNGGVWVKMEEATNV